jgi:hypothetical protein
MNKLEYDTKRALLTSPNSELQWHELRDELFKKYEKEYADKASFTTILHRKLQNMDFIEKKSLAHQRVFYFISKENLLKVSEEIDRETAHKRFDKVWDSFSPEQRKRELQNLLRQRSEPIMILQNFSLELLPLLSASREDALTWIKKLETPSEEIMAKYSEEERIKKLRELHSVVEEAIKTEDSIRSIQNPVSDENFESQLNLLKEFMNKVVEPNFSGNFQEAIHDLMRKAIEQQNKNKSGSA